MTSSALGIQALGVAFPRHYVALADLARARGIPETKYTEGLGAITMAVPSPEDDTVTLAAAASIDALARAGLDAKDIGLCVVGTETAVDHSKPVASFLQGIVGLPSNCRVFETKHACYGGTAGLMTALDWLASGSARGRSALVVCSDIARYGLHTPGEPTQGAGSVALVVSARPDLVAIDPASVGTSSKHVFDFWRPLESKDALVDGHYSVACYLEALAGAYDEHRHVRGDAPFDPVATLFHVPYPKMAKKAHKKLAELRGVADIDASYTRLVEGSLVLPSRIGNVYTGSLYLALASLLAYGDTPLDGRDVSFFSYGSGYCAEFFVGRFGRDVRRGYEDLRARVDAREPLDVAGYEAMFRARDEVREAEEPTGIVDPRRARFLGVHEGRRVYG